MDRENNQPWAAMVYPAMIGVFALVILVSAWFNVGQVVQVAAAANEQPYSSSLDVPAQSSNGAKQKRHASKKIRPVTAKEQKLKEGL